MNRSKHKHNEFQTITFFLEENDNISYANLRGQRSGAPITNTIIQWLKQEKLEDRQIASLTRYLRRLDKVLDENFSSENAYHSKQRRAFKLDDKLKEYISNYKTKLW